MCDTLEKVFGNPTSATLIARSHLSTVVHSQLCERANADRSKRTGSVYVEARREKAHELFLGLNSGRIKFDTVSADSLLAGFGMFRLVSGRSKPLTLCLAVGSCADCPMRSQTCKHLMAFRMLWMSLKMRPLWSDCELDTVLPRRLFAYPVPGTPSPPTCRQSLIFAAPAGVTAAPAGAAAHHQPAQDLAGVEDAALAPCTTALGSGPSATALAIVSRWERVRKTTSSALRRMRKLLRVGASGGIESLLGDYMLEEAEQQAGVLDAALREAEEGISVTVRSGAELLPSASDVTSHIDNRHIHRHIKRRGVSLNRKADHPEEKQKQARRMSRAKAAEDSPERPQAEPAAVLLSRVPATGTHRHRPNKHAEYPRRRGRRLGRSNFSLQATGGAPEEAADATGRVSEITIGTGKANASGSASADA